MTESEGRGVQALVRLANAALERLSRQEARAVVDGVGPVDLASMLETASAAGVATGTGGNLFYESAALRLRGLDIDQFGSCSKKSKRST